MFQFIRRLYPKNPCFIQEKSYSYEMVGEEVDKTIQCLRAMNICKGDRVIIALENSLEYVVLSYALAGMGAVKVPVNYKAGFSELEYVIRQTNPVLIISDQSALVKRTKRRFLKIHIIYLYDNWQSFLQLGDKDNEYDIADVDGDDVSDIIFTSGSTGNPKGAILTHNMLLLSAYASCLNRAFYPGWIIYLPIPLFHVYGYVEGMLAALWVGGCIVTAKGRFDPDQALQLMDHNHVNDILCVPTILSSILQRENLNKYNLKQLQAVYCSASICPQWIWKAIRDRLQVNEITTGYGMTEVCGATVQTDPGDQDEVLKTYLGKILMINHGDEPEPIISYRVIDFETGRILPTGVSGELICKGPVLMKNYIQDEMVHDLSFDDKGWFHTGDKGYFTEDGYLKLEGRVHDSYRINGENVSLSFLDRVIAACPQVSMVETVGIPDEKLGSVGVAFIEPTVYKEEVYSLIRQYCKRELAGFQVPRHYIFESSENWPKTSTGKNIKKQLQEIAIHKIHENHSNI